MNLTAVLLTGLLAGGVTCAAVQGGLLAGLITRQRAATAALAPAGTRPARVERDEPADTAPPVTRRWQSLVDDLAPVGGFLTGKLLSHAMLGGLLGALGSAVQLSVGASAALQLVAGAVVLVFGLAQLGVAGLRRIVVEPPQSFGRLVLRSSRSQAAFAPGLLGLASVLIPCGVTLSVEALALTSGSALAGAVTMAVFVIGTSPLFAVLGYAARKAATAWRGRLALATGAVVAIMGLFTLNGGLELAGSPVAASRVTAALAGPDSSPIPSAATVAEGRQTVAVSANPGGYTPARTQAKAGLPTTLVITSDQPTGCVRSFTIAALGVQQILPSSGETRIDLGVLAPGALAYACGMGMYTGTITAS
ncbi:sulfite exporter TauE/SafE family protein [Pseudonocardia sp. KRD291]|uniref:sulfite exporter TauE/SafE family protein n=1 Tax=Pseudonocardia sp. KRD291 TaxID=2792007 RepID=UPI001C5C108A|nr:sulfite exporter TauE/SafE family protein [Pseudonocardia sp. KRD291]MBW0106309.1 sulfite exporter TauE/SafE family protein [Pseudonocardia sp. KRD291]